MSRKLFLLFLCFSCLIVVPIHAQDWLTNGLIAYYDFNSEVADVSGNGHGGTNNGATFTADRFGNPNNAISFNNNIVTTGFFPPVSTNARTITGWFLTGTTSLSALFSYGGSQYGTGSRIEADINPSGTFIVDMSNGSQPTSSGGYNDSKWHQFAIVVPTDQTSTNIVVYIDGSVQGVMTGNPGFINTVAQTPLEFGQFYQGSRPYAGLLDDVRVYNRDLSADDVQQLYQYELLTEAPPPPHTATATASVVNGFVIGTTITDSGSGYTNVPGVHFVGVGSGAQATAVISNGVVVAINIMNTGSGYTNAPLVIIDPPVILNPVLNLQPMSFLVFSNLTVGTNYQLQALSSNSWVNQSASFTATNSVYSQMVTGLPVSINYRLARIPLPVRATGTAQLINGFVVGVNITSGGTGYTAAPTVQFIDTTGSGATATAKISGAGVVTNITVNATGSGYTAPSVVISAPTTVSTISPKATLVMRLDCSQLFPLTNCQVQVSSNLATAWNNWSSGLFVPITTTNSLFYFATNNAGLFRLKYTP